MTNKFRVVIDTNIFIHGWFGEDSQSQIIMDCIDKRKFNLVFVQDTIGELIYMVKNFARHNLSNVNDRIKMIHNVGTLFYFSSSANTMETKYEPTNDKYDDMYLKCAIEGNVNYLVTNDFKSGLHDKKNYNFKVVSAEDFVKILEVVE